MLPIAQGTRGKGWGHVEPRKGRTDRNEWTWARTKVPECVLELLEELYGILIHDYYLSSSILFFLSWELKLW
jgi:hypothetical protein